jgi:hypothetical protein
MRNRPTEWVRALDPRIQLCNILFSQFLSVVQNSQLFLTAVSLPSCPLSEFLQSWARPLSESVWTSGMCSQRRT